MLAAGVVCLELDFWPTVAAVRAAGLESGTDDRLSLARAPVPLDPVLRRLGRGSEGFHTACRAYAEAVWKRLHLAPVAPKEGEWGLTGWLDSVLDLLPRPLPACAAESLWGLAAEPLQVPEPGEVRCWMVPNEGMAFRLAQELAARVGGRTENSWVVQVGRDEPSTAPRPPVGSHGVLVMSGMMDQDDMASAERWADQPGCSAAVVGILPPGWQGAEEPSPSGLLGGAVLVGGEPASRSAARAAAGDLERFPDGAARATLNIRARWVWESDTRQQSNGRTGVEDVLSLRRRGLPEGLVCALAGATARKIEQLERQEIAVRVDGDWRLLDPPLLRRDSRHLVVAELFAADSPEALLHAALGGADPEPLIFWAEQRLLAMNGQSVRDLLAALEPGCLGERLARLHTEACLLEYDGAGADRCLRELCIGQDDPLVQWREAIDRSAEWSPRPFSDDQVRDAALAAASVAVMAWRREQRRGRETAVWHRQTDAAEERLDGAAERWVRLHRLALENPTELIRSGRVLIGHNPRLRWEWLQLRALEERERGRLLSARRALRTLLRVEGSAVGPGARGLVLLDLGSLELIRGRSAEADRLHLRAQRLLDAAGLAGRAEVAAFNLAVSDLDSLRLERAEERLGCLGRATEDPFVMVEMARLALARGDMTGCRELLAGMPQEAGAAALGEARSLLEGVLCLFDGDKLCAEQLLVRGGVEGEVWLGLLRALDGKPPAAPLEDGWGLALAARLAVRSSDQGMFEAELEPLQTSSLERRQALALALVVRLLPHTRGMIRQGLWMKASGVLREAGMGGWTATPESEIGNAELLEALAKVADSGNLGGLEPLLEGALLHGLGVRGLEIRGPGKMVRLGQGEPGLSTRCMGLEIIPLGGVVGDGPVWRLFRALLQDVNIPTVRGSAGEAPQVPGLVGSSDAMAEVRRDIAELAGPGFPVLVTGETGTGKELAARALHTLSDRKGGFVALNVAAIPENLVETELFGSVRGAFTGAESRQGLAGAAEGGTLFLDEIGELEPRVQAKLLRFLETGEVRPVGSTRSRKVKVRVVSATHRDIQAMVTEGKFRRDLYYRIATAAIRMPALRDRPEDLEELVLELGARLVARGDVQPARWTGAAMARLRSYHWPGNVRELGHIVAVALARAKGSHVSPEHLPLAGTSVSDHPPRRWTEALDGLRGDMISAALERAGGNRSAAARELGITRQTLLYHMDRLGIR